jgi:PAS domain S-box-containing protein
MYEGTSTPVVEMDDGAREMPTITRVVTMRTQGNEAEREALARLRAVIETAVDGIITIDATGVIETVNPAVVRIFGYAPYELIGRNVRVLMSESHGIEHDSYIAEYRQTGEPKIIGLGREVRGRRKDGSVFPMELAVSETRLDDRTIFTGIVRDISTSRRAEQALSESEERYRHLVQCLPAAVYACDGEGRITLFNEAAVTLWGRQPKVGRDTWCGSYRIYQLDGQRLAHDRCPMAESLRTGMPIRGVELVIERPDGTRRNVLAHPEPIVDSAGIVIGAVNMLIDITDRKRAESAMKSSETRFRLMADSAPNLIWMSGVNKACVWFNQRWIEFTGRTMEQEYGDGWSQGVHPEDLERCLATYNDAFDSRTPFQMEYRLRRADGEFRWVHDVGVPIHLEDATFAGYIGSCVDVTDRRLGEELLLERVAQRTHELSAANEQLQHQITERRRFESMLATENRVLELIATGAGLQQLLEALCEAIESLIPNTRCAIHLGDNEGAEPTSPVPTGAVKLGLNIFGIAAHEGIYPPICMERTIVPDIRCAADTDECLVVVGIRSYWLEPIAAPGGTMVGTLGVYSTDGVPPDEDMLSVSSMAARLCGIVVERARAEERAREQLAQLAHIGRLATMGEMASGLAHELNQPLCAIVNYTEACAEIINRNGQNREQLPEALAEVSRQAARAGEVIRRLRDFVKRREPERQPVDINKLVREVVAFTSVEARHNDVRIRMKLARQPPRVFADSIQIEQVLVNLVRNAGEAMRESTSATRALTIETTRRKGAVEVAVSDSGPGISDQTKQRLFEPFYTTKPDGMGMGLSISRSILEVHDGRIWVTPNRQGGTTFHFMLPTAWMVLRGRRHGFRRR